MAISLKIILVKSAWNIQICTQNFMFANPNSYMAWGVFFARNYIKRSELYKKVILPALHPNEVGQFLKLHEKIFLSAEKSHVCRPITPTWSRGGVGVQYPPKIAFARNLTKDPNLCLKCMFTSSLIGWVGCQFIKNRFLLEIGWNIQSMQKSHVH